MIFWGSVRAAKTYLLDGKKSCTQSEQMEAVGYISDTDKFIKASWSNFQHDGVAAFQLLEKSPLPPAWFAKDLPGG